MRALVTDRYHDSFSRLLAFLQSQSTSGFLEPRGIDLAHDAFQVDGRLDADDLVKWVPIVKASGAKAD